jgi:hypothetical protein
MPPESNALRRWLAQRLAGPTLDALVDERVHNALQALDDESWRQIAPQGDTLRPWHAVRGLLERANEACDNNPLAARLVGMTTDFVIGSGATLSGPPWAHAFWQHPFNRLSQRVYAWCDELSRSGELFVVLSRNPADGMSYVREVPALQIDAIETAPDDRELELRYHQLTGEIEGRWWPSAGAAALRPLEPEPDQVMLHYAINRPPGAVRGRSDLAAILPWLERYETWLEDRVRINRGKSAFLWHVGIEGAQPGQLEAKRLQYSRVPRPGSIIISDASERWQAVTPQINADDAEADGRALRLMIAAGAGVPLHYLGEGEGANRATAREMAAPTLRRFAQRQFLFASLLADLIRTAARRAGQGEIQVEIAFEPVSTEERRGE